MKAGAAIVDITPPVGLDLCGGAFGPSRSVLHPLSARALWMKEHDTALLLVACDLLGFGWEYANEVRRDIATALGIPVSSIMLTATHTHSGPATVFLRNWGAEDAGYKAALQTKLVALARQAVASAQQALLDVGVSRCQGVAVNRTSYGNGLTDDRVCVLRVVSATGNPVAVVVNFGCHPVNLHQSGVIAPDFPWHVERGVRARLGPVPVLFLNGPSGDINPANFDFRTLGDPSFTIEQRDALARATGNAIAQAAIAALNDSHPAASVSLGCGACDVPIPLLPLPSSAELEDILRKHTAALEAEPATPTSWPYTQHKTAVEWAQLALETSLRGRVETSLQMTVQVFHVGQVVLIGVPGELFTVFGIRIRDAVNRPCLIATLANGCFGYFATAPAYERHAYEAVGAPRHLGLYCFAPSAGDVLTEACINHINQNMNKVMTT